MLNLGSTSVSRASGTNEKTGSMRRARLTACMPHVVGQGVTDLGVQRHQRVERIPAQPEGFDLLRGSYRGRPVLPR